MNGSAEVTVEVHEPSTAAPGEMKRGEDLAVRVTVNDELVIIEEAGAPGRSYALEVSVLSRALAEAMA